MTTEHSFPDVLDRLNRGDPGAAEEVFRRFARQLVSLASHKLAGFLRQKVDPEDLVQSAFGSFFRAQPDGGFTLESWNSLWALLATITIRKCHRQQRRFATARRDAGREQPLVHDDSSLVFEAMAREPTPAEAAEFSETVRTFLDNLKEPGRTIAELTLQGLTAADIAPRVGLSERTVHRQLTALRSGLERMNSDPGSHS